MNGGRATIPAAPRSSPLGIGASWRHAVAVESSTNDEPLTVKLCVSSPPSRYRLPCEPTRSPWVHATGVSGRRLHVPVELAVSSASTSPTILRLTSKPSATIRRVPSAATDGRRRGPGKVGPALHGEASGAASNAADEPH